MKPESVIARLVKFMVFVIIGDVHNVDNPGKMT